MIDANGFVEGGYPVNRNARDQSVTLPGNLNVTGSISGLTATAGTFYLGIPGGDAYLAAGSVAAIFKNTGYIGVDGGNVYSNVRYFNTVFQGTFNPSKDTVIAWFSTNYSTPDAGIARNGSGVVEINSGTLNDYRDLRLRTLNASVDINATNNITAANQLLCTSGPPFVSFA